MNCVFCSIAQGDIPASMVHEDDRMMIFMDLNPARPGHLLIVPKAHADFIRDVAPEDATSMMLWAQRITDALGETDIPAAGANLFLADGAVAGQQVPHAHLHVIPRNPGDDFSVPWKHGDPARAELDQQAAAIAAALA